MAERNEMMQQNQKQNIEQKKGDNKTSDNRL